MFALELAYSLYQSASPPRDRPTGRDALGKRCPSCQRHPGFRGGGGGEGGVASPKLGQFTRHPRDAALGRSDVSSSTTPLCTATGAQHQACTAPLATPKLPEELFDFHRPSSHTGQTRRAESALHPPRVPAPRAALGWGWVTPAVAPLCLARTPENPPLGSDCLFVPSKYQRDTLRNQNGIFQGCPDVPRRHRAAVRAAAPGWRSPRRSRPRGLDAAPQLPSTFSPGLRLA